MVRNFASENMNSQFKFDFEIFNKDVYLSILHNPKHILNISISKFFASCQHLYTGAYYKQVLGNVFDPNSVPAFLVVETPIFWENEEISDQLPLARSFVRVIESFDVKKSPKIFFDKTYPDRMGSVLHELIEKYSKMKSNADRYSDLYLHTPDVPLGDTLEPPYMDSLKLDSGTFIGVNASRICLTGSIDWSRTKVSPQSKIKEVIIETISIPENFFKLNLDLDWVKFRYLKLNSLSNFDKMKFNSIAFEKCKFDGSLLKTIKEQRGINKFQINSCDISNLDLSSLGEVEEIQLLYTIDVKEKLIDVLGTLKFKSLCISGDVISNKENKEYISKLKKNGISIKIIGPII